MTDADTTGRVEALNAKGEKIDQATEDVHASAQAEIQLALDAMRKTREQQHRRIDRRHSSAPYGRAKRLLIADDNRETLLLYRRSVRFVVDFVDIAASVAEAKTKVETQLYDVMLLDCVFLNGTAKEIVQTVRTKGLKPGAWIILISSAISPTYGPELTKEWGANAWLEKPVDFERQQFDLTLQDAVQRGLSKRAPLGQ